MENLRLSDLKNIKFEDFPIKIFFRLLRMDDAVGEKVLGRKWQRFKRLWEEGETSLEGDRLLEDQKRAMLPLMQAQKAMIALQWAVHTRLDTEELFQEWNLPWSEDPKELVEGLIKFIENRTSRHQNNLIQLNATVEEAKQKKPSEFTIDDSIATLNLAGFTITDPDILTIGQYRAMNKTIERNGAGKTNR